LPVPTSSREVNSRSAILSLVGLSDITFHDDERGRRTCNSRVEERP
jgi:hypothetical protein